MGSYRSSVAYPVDVSSKQANENDSFSNRVFWRFRRLSAEACHHCSPNISNKLETSCNLEMVENNIYLASTISISDHVAPFAYEIACLPDCKCLLMSISVLRPKH